MMKASCQTNYAIPPGETLRETLGTIGMTQAQLVTHTRLPKKGSTRSLLGEKRLPKKLLLSLSELWESLLRSGIILKTGLKKFRYALFRKGCRKKTVFVSPPFEKGRWGGILLSDTGRLYGKAKKED